MTTKVNAVTRETFQTRVLEADGPVLVDFHADWCGPCQSLKPVLEALAKEFEDRAQVLKVDVDQHPALAQQYNVRGIPTLVLFKDGQVTDTVVGLRSKAELAALLEDAA